MIDLIIVGAGPAGLASSIYGRRANLNVLVFEGGNVGGQVTSATEIENYPGKPKISGFDLIMDMYNQAEELGAQFEYEKVIGIKDCGNYKEVYTESQKYECKAIILATGVVPRKLNLPNEDDLIGNGISYCAICDGAYYKDKKVAIVGGGNSAAMEALHLANLASFVTIIQDLDDLTCEQSSYNLIKNNSKIDVITKAKVTSLNGSDKLTSVNISTKEKDITLDIDGLFVCIGKIPCNEAFKEYVILDSFGYFKVDESCVTSTPGVFVAGDCRVKEIRQISTATSDGAIAAIKASNYIKNLKN